MVFGIGTDSGKTYITCELIQNVNLKFKKILAIKPIISGFDKKNYQLSDNFKLLNAMGIKNPSIEEVKSISKYMLQQPLSPDIASWKEGVEIDFNQVVQFCEEMVQSSYDILFIETAGGVCSPCSNSHTMADIAVSLHKYDVCNILVVNEYLGAISHTISALKVMKFDIVIFNRASDAFMQSVINHLPYELFIFDGKIYESKKEPPSTKRFCPFI